MKHVLFITILFLVSPNLTAGFIQYTGKYKVHGDKCYQQIKQKSSEAGKWEEFDCIAYLEDMHFNEKILSYIQIYYNFMVTGKVSKKAYIEIVSYSMDALSQKNLLNKDVILKKLRNDIIAAQKKHPNK